MPNRRYAFLFVRQLLKSNKYNNKKNNHETFLRKRFENIEKFYFTAFHFVYSNFLYMLQYKLMYVI